MACEAGKNNFWPASVQIPGIISQKIKWSVPRTSQLSITNRKIPVQLWAANYQAACFFKFFFFWGGVMNVQFKKMMLQYNYFESLLI